MVGDLLVDVMGGAGTAMERSGTGGGPPLRVSPLVAGVSGVVGARPLRAVAPRPAAHPVVALG
ncbi:hypothetical protein ACWCP6_35270 [Streptomyces sp. NPDC002004]